MEGPWAPQYMPNKSHTSRVMEDAEWNVQYGEKDSYLTKVAGG